MASKVKKSEVKKKVSHSCVHCHTLASSESALKTNFYTTYSDFNDYGRTILCKDCIEKLSIDNATDALLIYRLKDVLKFIDKPFLPDILESSIKSVREKNENGTSDQEVLLNYGDTVLGFYMRTIAMQQYKGMKWENTPVDETDNVISHKENIWGSVYNSEQVLWLDGFYKQMRDSHKIETPQHIQSVIMISKMQLRAQEYLDTGNMSDFSKLNKELQTTLTSSGLRPIDAKDSSESSGVRTFSQIFEEVEKDGYIKPKPVTYVQDVVDRMILYILNYSRKVFGKGILSEVPIDRPIVDNEPTRIESEEITGYIVSDEELEQNGKL